MCRLILGGYYFCLSWAYISSFLYGTQKDFPWRDLKVLHLSLPVHPLIALLSASPVSLWKCINMKQSHANLTVRIVCSVFTTAKETENAYMYTLKRPAGKQIWEA